MVDNEIKTQALAAQDLIKYLNSDDAELCHDMVEGETGLFEAITMAIAEIDEKELVIAGCASKIEQYSHRKNDAEKRVERIRGLIEQAMAIAELETVKLPVATLSIKKTSPKPIIENEALIPSQFWKQPAPVLDKAALNQAVKDGAIIEGVVMTNGGTSLQIRRL